MAQTVENLDTLSEEELAQWAGEAMREFCCARREDYPIKKPFLRDPLANLHNSILDVVLECPQAVHPYLSDYFLALSRLESEGFPGHIHAAILWRESGTQQLAFLTDKLAHGSEREAQLALLALLETREPEAVRLAARSPLLSTLRPLYRSDYLMHHASAEMRDGKIRFLASWETVYHLRFPEEYPYDPWHGVKHPTWNLPAVPTEFRNPFGGTVEGQHCAYCGDTLHRMITLPVVPEDIGITGLRSLTLATCLTCVGWETGTLYFRHDEAGTPTPLRIESGTERIPPPFHCLPLIETRVAVVPTPRRWHWQEWDHSPNQLRLGGHPAWVQSAVYPECPGCSRRMHFIMQLDSVLPLEMDEDHDHEIYYWGSGGLGYFFWCDECRISATHWQCT